MGEPTNAPAGHIKAIDRGSVHKICSGQVVLTLATAVKELVENSIDAGATSVEVKLKEYGSEMIEVVDNGGGVQEANFEGLTLKHHTSKLQEFSDLPDVETFGFRGEALSSLCALSQLSVTTRHKSVGVAHRLDYDNHGRLTSKTPCARQVGTTVCLQNLFSTLPVRHKEFLRHLKKEFSRMVQILNAYCIISTGVRINCTNQCGKGKKNLVVSTNGNTTLKDNIANIFGAKQLQSVLDFQQISPTDDICEELGFKIPEKFHIIYKVTGFVSSCCHGKGRSSTDRQFYFINQRPCDPTKVSKLVNEVYHMYNRHQYPFVALNIMLEKEHVDVNVTPDKRQIFVQEEKLLLAIIKSSLIKLYEPIHSVYQVNAGQGKLASNIASLSSMFKRTDSSQSDSESDTGASQKFINACTPQKAPMVSSLSKLKRSFSSAFAKDDMDTQGLVTIQQKQSSKQRRLDCFVSHKSPRRTVMCDLDSSRPGRFSLTLEKGSPSESGFCSSQEIPSTDSQTSSESQNLDESVIENEQSKLSDTCLSPDMRKSNSNFNKSVSEDAKITLLSETVKSNFSPDKSRCDSNGLSSREMDLQEVVVVQDEICTETNKCVSSSKQSESNKQCSSVQGDKSYKAEEAGDNFSSRVEFKSAPCEIDSLMHQPGETTPSASQPKEESSQGICSLSVTEMKYDDQVDIKKKQCCVNFSMKKLRQALADKRKNEDKAEFCRGFRAKIAPSDNQSAEEELQREIKKEMFAEMEILGQFNLGFIIARLKDDLFIIDQHATDEKYNFEMLQKNSVIQSQRMICPQNLELTASNEIILMDNLDIFKKNGFDFQIDEDAPPTQRIKLTSTPMSKNWTFGKEDIEEMLFMLSDSPGVSCRPSRVRQMFASRSCRKAVMIGTALDAAQMKTLVSHMGEIEQPWNCPHGRPTMRHLINLRMIQR